MTRRHASVVIGAAFGDEGKGLMTDRLAAGASGPATVVRFNGGAQAGHTVETPDGRRHVFHHFGSGAFAGAATHLSRFFVVNPILFLKERAVLAKLGAHLEVSVAPEAIVTTPWDMMINTSVELARGASRHGSCGMGIGETVGRNEETPWTLTVADLRANNIRQRLEAIRDEWVPARAGALELTIPGDLQAIMLSNGLIEAYLRDVSTFLDAISMTSIAEATRDTAVIFEGAQGLLLDQNAGPSWFPYVTRSNTGLTNAMALAQEARIEALDVFYMTRTYLTRHGAGPLPHEQQEPPFEDIVDRTNVPNDWQGTLRYAPLNLDLLVEAIRKDIAAAQGRAVNIRVNMGMTWVDRTPAVLPVVYQEQLQEMKLKGVLAALRQELSIDSSDIWLSRGPTRGSLHPEGQTDAHKSAIYGSRNGLAA